MNTENPNLTFEPMHLTDLEEVMKIENRCFQNPWTRTYYTLALKRPRPSEHFYVARLAHTLVGYIVFSIIHEEAHILNIAVTPDHQGQGIGKYLLASALNIIHQHRADLIFLEVAVSNLPAQYLYRQFGFRICGIRKNYYGRSQDAYLFRKGEESHVT